MIKGIQAIFVTERSKYLALFGVGLMLSALAIFLDPIVNRDAYVYMSAAEAYLAFGVREAFDAYGWPFYALFSAWLSQVSFLSLETCFFVINSVCYAAIPVLFGLLYQMVGDDKSKVWLAVALLFLLPGFNDYRSVIARDPGFWCFSLLALWLYLRFVATRKFSFAVGWQMAITLAALFRSEAVVLAGALPFVVFWVCEGSWRERLWCFGQLICLWFVGFIFGLIIVLLFFSDVLKELLNQLPIYRSLFASIEFFNHGVEVFREQVLPIYSQDYAVLILGIGLFALLCFKVLKKLGWVLLIMAVVSWVRPKVRFTMTPERKVLLFALLLLFLVLFVFVELRLFISGRYAILFVILLALWLACFIVPWWEHFWQHGAKWLRVVVAFVLVIVLLDNAVSTSRPKLHLKVAGEWLQDVVPDASVMSNDSRLLYYGRMMLNEQAYLAPDMWHVLKRSSKKGRHQECGDFDYLILRVKDEQEPSLLELIKHGLYQEIKRFDGPREREQAIVYRCVARM